MKFIGIGIDITEISRVRNARFRDRVAEYVLCPEEREEMMHSRDGSQFLASRFAAKEAVIKAYPLPLAYQDILIEKNGNRPVARVRRADIANLHVEISISHSFEFAIACAHVCAITV